MKSSKISLLLKLLPLLLSTIITIIVDCKYAPKDR